MLLLIVAVAGVARASFGYAASAHAPAASGGLEAA